MPPKKQKVPPAQPLPAEGSGGKKRTPQSAFDPAKGQQTYEPEKIVATRLKNIDGKSITQYCVKWKGYDAKQNTWEPIEHLAGCEDMITAHHQEKKQKDAELDAIAEETKRTKEEEQRQKDEAAADAAAAARVAAGAVGNGQPAATAEPPAAKQPTGPPAKSHRTAKCWECFDETGAPEGKACCTLPHPKKLNEVCSEAIGIKHGPSGMWNHLQFCHPNDFLRLKEPSAPLPKIATTALGVSESKRDELAQGARSMDCQVQALIRDRGG
jgi:hypothetical protein